VRVGACVVVVWVLGMSVRSREPSATARLPGDESASRLQHVLEVGARWRSWRRRKTPAPPPTVRSNAWYVIPESVMTQMDDFSELQDAQEGYRLIEERFRAAQDELTQLKEGAVFAQQQKEEAYNKYARRVMEAFFSWYDSEPRVTKKTGHEQLILEEAIMSYRGKYGNARTDEDEGMLQAALNREIWNHNHNHRRV